MAMVLPEFERAGRNSSYYRLFVATSLEKVMTNAGRAKGFRSVHQEKVLRHFTAELEPYE